MSLKTNSLWSSTSFVTVNSGLNSIHFVVLFQVFKCLVPDIADIEIDIEILFFVEYCTTWNISPVGLLFRQTDKYKCVFTNSREYVQEAVLEFLPSTCSVLAPLFVLKFYGPVNS